MFNLLFPRRSTFCLEITVVVIRINVIDWIIIGTLASHVNNIPKVQHTYNTNTTSCKYHSRSQHVLNLPTHVVIPLSVFAARKKLITMSRNINNEFR